MGGLLFLQPATETLGIAVEHIPFAGIDIDRGRAVFRHLFFINHRRKEPNGLELVGISVDDVRRYACAGRSCAAKPSDRNNNVISMNAVAIATNVLFVVIFVCV